MGAGILPTTIHEGQLYFLFGKENRFADTPGFSDIGGGQDGNENYLEAAIREGTEELTGFLGSEEELKKMLQKHGTYNIDFPSLHGKIYRMHIFPIKYDPMLPHYYNNNAKFLQKKLDPKIIEKSKIFEKDELRWVPITQLHKMQPQFRSYFQPHIDVICSQKEKISKFISGALNSNKSKKSRKGSIRRKRTLKRR